MLKETTASTESDQVNMEHKQATVSQTVVMIAATEEQAVSDGGVAICNCTTTLIRTKDRDISGGRIFSTIW